VVNWQDRLNPKGGGAEIHLHEIFGRLAEWGHPVKVLASGFQGAPGIEILDGMEVHRVGGRYNFSLVAPFYFRRKWPSGFFDVIVEDLNKVPVFLPLFTKTPVVLLVHHLFGATAFREASFPVAAATWLSERPIPGVYRKCPLVAVSPSTVADLRSRGFDTRNAKIVPNGVDLDRLVPCAPEEEFPRPTILYLGRLKRYKRIDLILRAVAALKQRGLHLDLLVAGKGDDEARLQRLARKLEVDPVVRFLGFVDEGEKVELLQRSWIHVLTSPKEGWGISVMEAAACGTPTVASDSPGLRDAVIPGATGLLVPHGNVEALADALLQLMREEERRREMGRAAREHAESYSWDRSAREMLSFLEDRAGANRPES